MFAIPSHEQKVYVPTLASLP